MKIGLQMTRDLSACTKPELARILWLARAKLSFLNVHRSKIAGPSLSLSKAATKTG